MLQILQDLDRLLWHRHKVIPVRLGTRLGQKPVPSFEVEFAPGGTGDLSEALAEQDEQTIIRPERLRKVVQRYPDHH